ncbi:MAG: hypothetical protein Q9198_007462 [Flavoplaca austrocitrina]
MDHFLPDSQRQPNSTLSSLSPLLSDIPICTKPLPIQQLAVTPSPPNPHLNIQSTAPLLSLPTEIHLLIFQHLNSIHTLCLLAQTCKHLRGCWLDNALSICTNRAQNHADKGCELALLQQRNANTKIPNWRDPLSHGQGTARQRERQLMQTNKDIADRVVRNNGTVNQAGEKLLSELHSEKFAIGPWTVMRSRLFSPHIHQTTQQQHAVGQGFRAETVKMTLSVEQRRRFEDAYYGYWIGVEDGRGEKGGMRHGELDLRSLFMRKVLLKEGKKVRNG